MSNLTYRTNTILVSSNSAPAWGASYTVTAYDLGAVATSASTETTITVRAGHGFSANDYLLIESSGSIAATSYRKVTVSAATTLTISANLTVAAGDKLINLGTDTGTTSPNYNGSTVSIYNEPSGAATAITASRVTCDAQGVYEYWHANAEMWELVRDSDGDPVAVIPDVVGGDVIGPGSSTDNAIPRFDGTSGKKLQACTSGDPTIADTGAITASAGFVGALTGNVTGNVTGNLTGDVTATNVEINGALNHDGTTVGFYDTTPVTRPSAYTQTYSTADKTHAAATAAVLTDSSGGSASQTLAAITGGGEGCEDATKNAIASLADEVNKLIADVADAKQLINSVIDDLQALGLFQ